MSSVRITLILRGIIAFWALLGITNLLFAQEIPITTSDGDAQSLFVQGRDLFDNLRYDEAQELFDQALQKDPDFAMANVYRALAATSDADFAKYLDKAVSRKSQVSDGERLIIESLKASSENDQMKSINLLREAIESYPQDKRLHHLLGISYQGARMTDEAKDQYTMAINIDPNYAPAYNNLGYLFRQEGNFEEAENAFQNYIRVLPDEANPHDSIGDLYTKMGKYDMAIEHYQKAVSLNPKFFFSQQKIGDNLVFKGKFAEGRAAYNKALAMAPDVANKIVVQQGLANTWLFENNPDRAIEDNKLAIKWAEENSLPENAATIYQMQALINLENGRLQEAKANLEACDTIVSSQNLTENRKHRLSLLSLRNNALLAAKSGNFDQAMDFADQLGKKVEEAGNPNEIKMANAVSGIIYYEKGDYPNAIAKLNESDVNSPHAQFYLAESYQKAGQAEEAQAIYKKVAQWNENNLEYALVRTKAMTAARTKLASEEEQ
jgi:tetratricopeptide (TPR) repeat protein